MTTIKDQKRIAGHHFWVAAAILCLVLCAVMMPARAADKQKNGKPVTYTTHTDGVTVTATADKGVLSDDAQLVVKAIDKDAASYKAVEKQVKDANKNVAGFLAYDISFTDGDHKAIEPKGDVSVKLDWDEAAKPDGAGKADDVSLLHLKENKDGKVTKTEDLTKHDTTKLKQSKGKIESASFTTDSFSVFTITWTTTEDGTTSTIGNVSMHYVNEDGLEIDRTATLDDGDLAKTDGDVVKISDWVNDANDENKTRKVSGYKYVKATIGTFKGKEITAVKVQSDGSNGYKLYYTSVKDPDNATDSDWTLFTDSVSKNDSNNADIYLVFHSTAQRINVHFVDEDGNILINPIYHYANETYEKINTHEVNVKDENESQNPWAEPIQNYTFTGRVHMGETGWQGFAFSRIKATVDDNGNYRYQYSLDEQKAGQADDWTDLTATDVYLIYKKTMPTKLSSTDVQIHYIDADGNPMKDEAGNSLDRVVDATTWTKNQWQNLQGYSESVNGYTINDMAIFVTDNGDSAYTNRVGINSNNGLDGPVTKNPTSGQTISGYTFRYLRYTDSGFQAGNGYQLDTEGNRGSSKFKGEKTDKTAPDTKINRYWDVEGGFQIYLVYNKNTTGKTYSYTIHYVDENGNNIPGQNAETTTFNDSNYQVGNTFTAKLTGSDEGTRPDNFSHNIAKDISGYTVKDYGFLGRATEASGGIPFKTVTYTKTGDNQWSYQINGEGETKELNLTNLDFYVVYKKNPETPDTADHAVTIHFVDTKGNDITSNGGKKTWETRVTLKRNEGKASDTNVTGDIDLSTWHGWDFTNQKSFSGSTNFKIPDGYSFVGEYLGPKFNMDKNKLVTTTAPSNNNQAKYVQWLYKDNKWYISHGDSSNTNHEIDGTDPTVFEGYVTDIYWVYTKSNITVHYIKLDDENNTVTSISGQSNQTISSLGTKDQPTNLTNSTYAPKIDGLTYIGTRLGPSSVTSMSDLGPDARNVYLDNGKRIYFFTNPGDKPYPMTKQGNNDMWLYAAPTGRRFTLRKTTSGGDNGNNKSESYTIEDSQNGTFTLNKNGTDTYAATFHGETETTEYTVKKSTSEGKDTYELTVHNYLTSDLNDIYEVYRADDSDNAKITINNDLKYSGYLISDLNSWLKTRMDNSYNEADKITDYYYSWNKITTGDGYEGDKNTEVVRAQNGPHWNIAYNRKERTALDVEADNGGRNDTDQKTVAYTVTFHYKIGNGTEWQTVTSPKCTIDYYSQLMNGSFETPDKTENPGDYSGDYSNARYKELGGVWQTTGLGSLSNKNGMDIEIVNTTDKQSVANAYSFANADAVTTADGGNQFAELNAETAGALYQDVVTHPNTYLNYWLSHRARGNNKVVDVNNPTKPSPLSASQPEYDTMYLIIMPTKLAMTSAADGGELKTQSDLTRFIQNHGGYDSNLATAVGQEVTYRDENSGILIEKISSNDQFWHHVSVPNGYIAKGGLTRFFFAAGPTTADYKQAIETRQPNRQPTMGNFIDAVGFDQQLPTPDGFNLTVSKTFSGLSTEQIAGLVKDKDDNNKFKITLSDHYADPNSNKNATNDEDTPPNSTLNKAVLSFTINNNGSTIPFTATAVDEKGTNLLTGSNRGSVKFNDDGSLTMTWTFYNEAIDSDKTDERFNYFAEESNGTVDQYTLNADKQIVTKDKDSTTGAITTGGENTAQLGAAIIQKGTDATFTLNNTYRSYRESDQPRIVVSKTFKGVTPSAVDELFADGYQLTVTKKNNDGKDGSSEVLTTNDAALDNNVTYTKSEDDNHNTTVHWIISGEAWTDGTYDIAERKYSNSDYKVTQVEVNGDQATIPPDLSADLSEKNISVGDAAKDVTFSKSSTDVKTETAQNDGSLTKVAGIPKDTNFVAVQYTNNTTTNYLVWTATPIGRNVSAAILNKINGSGDNGIGWESDADATFSNTIFRSGEAGAIETSGGSINFDHDARTMTFSTKEDSQLQWKKFYSTKISGEGQADIRVTNRYNPVVRIQKVDSSDDTKTLSGAEFKLFKMDGRTRQYIKTDGTVDETSGGTGATFTTGSDGTINLPALPAGDDGTTYYLEETKAPDGYNKIAKLIAFTVNSDDSVGQAKNTGAPGIAVETPEPDWNHPFYTITVTNSAGTVLPITGGMGTALFIIIGALIAIAATMAIVKRRQNLKA